MNSKFTGFLSSRRFLMQSGLVLLLFASAVCNGISQVLQPQSIDIPMSDGKTLSAHLYLPSSQGSYPVVFIQTPYNKNLFQFGLPLGVVQDLVHSPYAFVIMDWRCFYGSLPACTINPDRGQDGYDAVEWIAAQPWCNGKVATWGPSALGNIQFQTARKKPPHMVCAIPIVAAPQSSYVQYYPGGALRTEYLETLNYLFGASSFNPVVNNPIYNIIWIASENFSMYPDEIEVPMLLIGGWFDHNTNDVITSFDTLRALSPVASQHHLLMGPWTHSGASGSPAIQGELSFPEAQSWSINVANEFLAYQLLGEANGWDASAPVQYFQMGDNTWLQAEKFPPAPDAWKDYYLYENLEMGESVPFADSAALDLIYDPENPSPTIGGKTLGPDLLQGPYDQSEVESRSDALVFTGPTLTNPVRVVGQTAVTLHVSSDRKDTDFALRLTDVAPDGKSILLGETIQRMRFRNGYTFSDTASMVPGEVYEISLKFDHLAHTFLPGHRIRLIVTSSNYPRYNRNMNTGEEMYPNGNFDTLVNPLVAHNKLLVQGTFLSRISFPISEATATHESAQLVELELFPNPAKGQVFLRNLPVDGRVFVYDLNGRMVLNKQVRAVDGSLEIAQLQHGHYLLRFLPEGKTTDKSYVGKLSVGW